VQRALHHSIRRAFFHDFAAVHNHNTVRHKLSNVEVVGYKNHSEPQSASEIVQERKNLSLNRNIQRRDGLVSKNQRRLRRQGPGYRDTLSLASTKLMGVALQVLRGQPDLFKQMDNTFSSGFTAKAEMDRQCPTDGHLGLHARIQGRERVLKNELDVLTKSLHLTG
jgi:hypothetical protein